MNTLADSLPAQIKDLIARYGDLEHAYGEDSGADMSAKRLQADERRCYAARDALYRAIQGYAQRAACPLCALKPGGWPSEGALCDFHQLPPPTPSPESDRGEPTTTDPEPMGDERLGYIELNARSGGYASPRVVLELIREVSRLRALASLHCKVCGGDGSYMPGDPAGGYVQCEECGGKGYVFPPSPLPAPSGPTECGAPSSGGAWHCILTAGHDGRHRGVDGRTWPPAPSGESGGRR